ncbi:MAG TPA: DUF86 domain-containing protein [Tepidisphaeraceae bacterium]|nr:DUF86 domain-containing protein [Tepidisphaeraceae bacterium]
MRSETALFIDMLKFARRVAMKVSDCTFDRFERDDSLHLSTAHLLQMIGEAARQVPAETRTRYPSLPWRQIVGMRHIIVHEYHRLELEPVWQTALEDIPVLIALLEPEFGPILDSTERPSP